MKKGKSNKEEKEVLGSYETDNWESVPALNSEKEWYQEYAKATFRQDGRVTVKISAKDMDELQKKAIEEGIPYQTLIASVLHKFISGRFTTNPPQSTGKI
jgi:predicted DNA binding CopG/RHH family protein